MAYYTYVKRRGMIEWGNKLGNCGVGSRGNWYESLLNFVFNFLDLVIKIQSGKEDHFSSMLNPNLSLKILIIKVLFIQEYI